MGGNDHIRISPALQRHAKGRKLLTRDKMARKAKSQCIANIFLQPGGGWRYQVAGQKHSDDGRQLKVDYSGAR